MMKKERKCATSGGAGGNENMNLVRFDNIYKTYEMGSQQVKALNDVSMSF